MYHEKINKSGFTLLELLATIVVLAIILTVTVPTVTGIIEKSQVRVCQLNRQIMERAALNYYKFSGVNLPNTEGQTVEVSLEELINSKLVSAIIDPKTKKDCDAARSKVVVKRENGAYTFSSFYYCDTCSYEGEVGNGDDSGNSCTNGNIKLNLYYPEYSINQEWRLGSPGDVRSSDDYMWQPYTGPICIPLDQTENVWIRYGLNNVDVTVPPLGQLLVDIDYTPKLSYQSKVTVNITYDNSADRKEYKVGASGWMDYTGPFEVTENTTIKARVVKNVEIKDDAGNLIGTTYIINTDQLSIGNIGEKEITEDLVAPQLAKKDAVGTEKALVEITYPDNGKVARPMYKINGGVEAEYTGDIPINVWGSRVTGYYYDSFGNKSKEGNIVIKRDENVLDVMISLNPDPQIDKTVDSTQVTIEYDDEATSKTYKIDNGTEVPYAGAFNVSEDATITAYARNDEGDSGTATRMIQFKKSVELSDPTITSTISGDKTKATVVITYPAWSTVNLYNTNGGELTGYTESFDVFENGTVVYAEARDDLGNVRSASYTVTGLGSQQQQMSAPSITGALASDKSKVTVSITYDALSIIDRYSINGGELIEYTGSFDVLENGTIIYAEAQDSLGNIKSASYTVTGIGVVQQEMIAPTISGSLSTDKSKVIVKIVYDKLSIIDRYSIDGGTLKEYTGSFDVVENGTVIYAEAQDSLGNIKSASYTVAGIIKPLDVSISADPEDNGTVVDKVLVTVNYDSTATTKTYYINGKGPTNYTGPFEVTENCTIKAEAKNTGGYGVATKMITNVADGIASPTIKMAKTKVSNGEDGIISITYDPRAVKEQYSIDDGPLQYYTESFQVSENGTTIYAYSEDEFGNTSYASYKVTGLKKYLVINMGKYYIVKLNYPTQALNKQYKYTDENEWKPYKSIGFALIQKEYESELVKGDLPVMLEDENGNLNEYTGDWYIVDVPFDQIATNIYMRWDDPTSGGLAKIIATPPNDTLTMKTYIIILPPADGTEVEYKINNGAYQEFNRTLVVIENNITITAHTKYMNGTWSNPTSYTVTNIDSDNVTIIRTVDDFNYMRDNPTGLFILGNDIDLSGVTNWAPIQNFSGIFDGNGKTLSNLKITGTTTGSTGYGLFSTLASNAMVSDLKLDNVNIAVNSPYVGSLAGQTQSNVTISNVGVTGSVSSSGSGDSNIGGLVGNLGNGSTVNKCYNKAIVTVNGSSYYNEYVGGLLGRTGSSTSIKSSYNMANITGNGSTDYTGGLIGYNYGTVSKSFSAGNVKGTSYVGGLIGNAYSTSSVDNCYAAGNVENTSASAYIGGLMGYASSSSDIVNSHSVGLITTASSYKGGMTNGGATSSNSYWNVEVSRLNSSGSGQPIATLHEGVQQASYNSWDFANVWTMQEGVTFPYLKGMPIPDSVYKANQDVVTSVGTGTIEDPYQIKTTTDLTNMYKSPYAYFEIMNDIDLSGVTNWVPVEKFGGILDGNNKVISNLKITGTTTGSTGYGLFGTLIANAMVSDLKLDNVNIAVNGSNVGSLAGQTQANVMISNVGITGTVSSSGSGDSNIAGLVGNLGNGSTVNSSYNKAIVTVNGSSYYSEFVGGLVGRTGSNTSIKSSYNMANITGNGSTDYTGGLIGYNYGAVSKSLSAGNVKGTSYVGGLMGNAYSTSTVDNCYAAGNVENTSTSGYIGGLIGYASSSSDIVNSHSVGLITTASSYKGGMTNGGATSSNSYWNVEVSRLNSSGSGQPIATLHEGVQQASYNGWDFTNVWTIQEGITFPYLKGMPIPDSIYKANQDVVTSVGTGTIEDPYQLKTASDLTNMYKSPYAYFEVMNDIDLSGVTNWAPIEKFGGILDGNNKVISNLKITGTTTGSTGYGMFGTLIANAMVSDLKLDNVNIAVNGSNVGSLAGQTQSNVMISNVGVTGSVSSSGSGDSNIAGLVGNLGNGSTVNNSYNKAILTVNGSSYYSEFVGGLVGRTGSSTSIKSSYSMANITGNGSTDYTGGLIGYNYGDVSKSFSAGNVKGTSYVGGLIGNAYSTSTVDNCYAAGNVENTSTSGYIGGLIGYASSSNIINSHSAGLITTASSYKGGMTNGSATSSNSYWNVEISRLNSSGSGQPIATLYEGVQQASYNGWDFTNVWAIQEGVTFPYLKGMPIPTSIYKANQDVVTSAGTGTIADPYQIKTVSDLTNMYKSPYAYFEVMNDIDLSGVTNWAPIEKFGGILDGNNKVISNLKITGTTTGSTGYGLFGTLIANAMVSDLKLDNVNIAVNGSNVGSLAGQTQANVMISNVGVTGTVSSNGSGESNIAGLVGNLGNGSTVNNSYNKAIVTVNGSSSYGEYVGGLIGRTGSSTSIKSSYNMANITGNGSTDYTGGLIGYNYGTVSKSFSAGNVKGTSYAGGLISYAYSTSAIDNCYAAGNVENTSSSGYIGGLIGYASSSSNIVNSHSVGLITTVSSYKGGMANGSATSSNSYWNVEISRLNSSGSGQPIATLYEGAQQASYNGWDFTNVWTIQEGVTFPYLKGMPIPDGIYRANQDVVTSTGTGTIVDPYQIKVVSDLTNMYKSPYAYFEVMNDIDLSGVTNWAPIEKFGGILDGNNKIISNLKITGTTTGSTGYGLFGTLIANAMVSDLKLDNVNITVNGSNVGSLSGQTQANVTISNVGVAGSVSSNGLGESNIAGLVGNLGNGSTVNNSYNKAIVTVNGSSSYGEYVGGLIGRTGSSTSITSSYNMANITGNGSTDYTGGLIGYNYGTVSKSFNASNIKGMNYVGGLIGYVYSTSAIDNCYAAGNVENTSTTGYIGGLIGYTSSSNIVNSHSVGLITTVSSHKGGMTNGSATSSNSYWNVEVSGLSSSGSGQAIATIQAGSLQASYNGWDFTNVWTIQEGITFPYLKEMPIPDNVYISNY